MGITVHAWAVDRFAHAAHAWGADAHASAVGWFAHAAHASGAGTHASAVGRFNHAAHASRGMCMPRVLGRMPRQWAGSGTRRMPRRGVRGHAVGACPPNTAFQRSGWIGAILISRSRKRRFQSIGVIAPAAR